MNERIIEALKVLKKYYTMTGDSWRQRAYAGAIASIQNYNKEITSEEEAKKIPGIGKAIASKIGELLETGEITRIKEIQAELGLATEEDEKATIISNFEKIWGVGPVKAAQLYLQGFKSIENLREHVSILNPVQRIGLKYYEDLQKKIPRAFITLYRKVLYVAIRLAFPQAKFTLTICGSYRRGLQESGDIDCLIVSKDFNLYNLIQKLQQRGLITDILALRKEKFMGIAHCIGGPKRPIASQARMKNFHFRLDIEFVPENEYYTSLNYFTGSQGHNIWIRSIAKKQGYKLDQHGLFRISGHLLKRIPIDSEEDIYNVLSLKYLTPLERNI